MMPELWHCCVYLSLAEIKMRFPDVESVHLNYNRHIYFNCNVLLYLIISNNNKMKKKCIVGELNTRAHRWVMQRSSQLDHNSNYWALTQRYDITNSGAAARVVPNRVAPVQTLPRHFFPSHHHSPATSRHIPHAVHSHDQRQQPPSSRHLQVSAPSSPTTHN